MIDRLRRSVFRSIFLTVTIVLLAILAAMNILNLVQTADKANDILDSAADLVEDADSARKAVRRKNRSELLRSVSVDELDIITLDASGQPVSSATGVLEEDGDGALSGILSLALTDESRNGVWQGWYYRLIWNGHVRSLIVLNPTSLYAEAREFFALSLVGFLVACLFFALLARVLARRITAPVADTLQGQKRFIADASHELKTPLTVIDANAAVLEKSIGKNQWLSYIQSETRRMNGLVRDLLRLSALDEARQSEQEAPPVSFDAVETLMEAALPFESVAFEQGETLSLDLPERMPAAGHPQDLEQIAAILIDNAVKHAGEGGEIRVKLTERKKGHGRAAALSISNTGPAIPPEALPHLFERFYKTDSSRKYSENSYGLGLAIAKGIAEQHRWELTVQSGDGNTVFLLEFPLHA